MKVRLARRIRLGLLFFLIILLLLFVLGQVLPLWLAIGSGGCALLSIIVTQIGGGPTYEQLVALLSSKVEP